MTKEEIIKMAQDVGAARLHSTGNIIFGVNALKHFVLLVAAAEREACAVIAFNAKTYIEAAETIRARGQHD